MLRACYTHVHNKARLFYSLGEIITNIYNNTYIDDHISNVYWKQILGNFDSKFDIFYSITSKKKSIKSFKLFDLIFIKTQIRLKS